MWFRPHPWSMCRLELLVRLVPLPPIRTFLCAKLRFLRKVRKSMSFKMILNSHNSLFAHIFFNSHFIRYQRLKEQGASSYGLSTDAFSALLKKSAEILFQYPLSLKINTPFLITQHGGSDACGGMAEKFPPLPPFRHMFSYIPACGVFRKKFLRAERCAESYSGI